ncbi:heme ABC exporter ATP-binding protein CcmA [Methylocystis sp.]|uniref:heme ABC exporter ATP-binding protein CcmA n=1 Tax=Methylocystis sp. TaxID=1911079 RepID=UPI0025F15CA4|nr:heme ABC exporter ATP-binding protein CcmA [Methylocystis sp.]
MRLCVENLSVSRGGRMVLDRLSFSLSSGRALVVTGPNGAGKSTLLRALAGLLPRAGGSVGLAGGPPEAELPQQAHYLAHSDGMKAALTVEENLDFWSAYLAQTPDQRNRTVEAALGVVGLSHVVSAPLGVLSAGQKRRAALARLLVAFRPLWLLDEPLTALDRASRDKFAAAMREHCAQGGLIVAATHEPLGLEEAKELALGSAG